MIKKMSSGAMIHPKITFKACFFYMVSKAILLYTKISTFWFWWLQIKFRSTRVSVISLKVIENIEFINNLLKSVEFWWFQPICTPENENQKIKSLFLPLHRWFWGLFNPIFLHNFRPFLPLKLKSKIFTKNSL